MSRSFRQTLATLAILMVACGQIFGLQKGFVCDCGGHEHVTMLDHCHGLSGDGDHDHDDHDEEPWHDSGQHEDEDTHEHPANVESVTAESSVQLHFTAPTLAFIALLSHDWQELQSMAAKAPAAQALPPWQEHDTGQRWPHVLAHAVVLRI